MYHLQQLRPIAYRHVLLRSSDYNTSNAQHSYSTAQGHGETEDRFYTVAGDQRPSHVARRGHQSMSKSSGKEEA